MQEYYDPYLCHYGVLGMKWGVRRYQNKDGSLTSKGLKRQKKRKADIKLEQKHLNSYNKLLQESEKKMKDLKKNQYNSKYIKEGYRSDDLPFEFLKDDSINYKDLNQLTKKQKQRLLKEAVKYVESDIDFYKSATKRSNDFIDSTKNTPIYKRSASEIRNNTNAITSGSVIAGGLLGVSAKTVTNYVINKELEFPGLLDVMIGMPTGMLIGGLAGESLANNIYNHSVK